MVEILAGLRKAVFGLSIGLLAMHLVIEAPSRVFAQPLPYGPLGPCPTPKTPTGCGTAPDCVQSQHCEATGTSGCNCNGGLNSCPCVSEGEDG
jgi:hypothetical protein